MISFPKSIVPKEVRPLAHFLKLAKDHDATNLVVAYWARMSACLLASRLVPGDKSPEAENFICKLSDWLEDAKKANQENEGITSETTAKTLIEEYAFKVFECGNENDKAQIFNKHTVKYFYTAGMLIDVLEQFGTLPDNMKLKRNYAKWKAVDIYNTLKAGELPLPGPPRGEPRAPPKEELATDKKYTGPLPLGDVKMDELSADKPVSPNTALGKSFRLDIPKTDNANNSASVLASSPMNDDKQPTVTPEQLQKAQMYCEFVTSALKHNDVKSAVENLHKTLDCLQ